MKEIYLNTVRKTKNYRKYQALISDKDFDRVSNHYWSVVKSHTGFRAQSRIEGKLIYLHVFFMGFTGVDHVNGDGLDCQRGNLRKATKIQNMMNRGKPKGIHTSRFKGVFRDKERNKWCAQTKVNGKSAYIGRFETELEAAVAYNSRVKQLHGVFAQLNIIE